MTYTFIAQHCEDLPVAVCCRVMRVSTSAFYAWQANPVSDRDWDDAQLTNTVFDIHTMSRRSYGSPRVHAELVLGAGIRCGRKRVERLMREAGICGIHRRRGHGCTRRDPAAEPADDLVNRAFDPEEPDRLWMMDITEHPTDEGKVYLAVVLDAFSRRVVGWSIADHIRAEPVVDAVQMAVWRRRPPPGRTIAHSDRGSQTRFNRSSQHRLSGPRVDAHRGFGGCLPTEGLAGSAVEHGCNCVNLFSVPAREISALGEVLAQESVGVLVAAALPRTARVGEVDRDAGLDFERCMLRELLASVPSQGSAELLWEGGHLGGERVLHRDRSITGERRPVLDGVLVSIALFSRQMDQQGEPRGPLDQRADRRAFQPDDEVAFPVPGDGTIVGLGGSLTDHHLRGDVAPGLLL